MKTIVAAIFIAVVLSFSCTRPLEGDFGFQQLGLGEDEFLWVLRINRDPAGPREGILSPGDSLQFEQYNSPIFTQALPLIIRDILADSLKGYEDYEFVEEEKVIDDLGERMVKLGVNRQNFSSLLQSCDLLMIVKSGKGLSRFTPKFLRLVWRDPAGRLPERNFACVKFSDIEKRNYRLEIRGEEVSMAKVLREMRFHYFPVYLRNNSGEYSIQSPEEAHYLDRMVMSGNWDKVTFIDEAINISGANKISLRPSQLFTYSGIYQVAPDSAWREKRTLYLTVEQDYLVADWTHRSLPEKIYPFYENAYFSPRGEFYLFPDSDDTLKQELRFVSKGDTLNGIRTQRIYP